MKQFYSFLLTAIICSSSQMGFSQANLIYFNGAQVFQYIDLTWGTSSEVNTDYFTIERGLDGINFTPVMVSSAAGNSSSNMSYVRTDSSAFLDTCYYYRLKVTMFNGSFNYLDTISVCYTPNTNGIINKTLIKKLIVFPNPAPSYTTVTFESQRDLNNGVISLLSADGRLVSMKDVIIREGKNDIRIELNAVPLGVYFIEINTGDFVAKTRFMVIR